MASLFTELKRRNVFRVAAAYAVVGWLAVEIASVVLPALLAPEWVHRVLTFLVILGFPIVLIFAWAYELTAEGLKREKDVDRSQSITPQTGRKLDFMVIGLLSVALIYFVSTHDWSGDAGTESAADVETVTIETDSQPSVAVLPFANRSALADDAFFAEGIHDDILTSLAKIGSLKVISRTSVLEYEDTKKNMRTIGEELGVGAIVEGGVQRAGDRVRINVQLIDTQTDEHLWAESYDRELSAQNVFSIQSEIAENIAVALKAALSPEEESTLQGMPTDNLDAYDAYLRAEILTYQIDALAQKEALQNYLRATELDPKFAVAWARLSNAYAFVYWNTRDREYCEKALAAVRLALALNPQLPEGHWAMGFYHYWCNLDYGPATEEFTIAQRGMPGKSDIYLALAFVQRRQGLWEESLGNFEKGLQLDPRNSYVLGQVAEHLTIMHRYEDAGPLLRQAIALDPSDTFTRALFARNVVEVSGDVVAYHQNMRAIDSSADPNLMYRAWQSAFIDRDFQAALEEIGEWSGDALPYQYYYYPKDLLAGFSYQAASRADLARGHFEISRTMMQDLISGNAEDPRYHAALGLSLAGLGEKERAIREGQRATELYPSNKDLVHSRSYIADLGLIYAMLDEAELAAEQFEIIFSGPGWPLREVYFLDPRLDPIRDDSAFKELEAKYRRVSREP